MIIRYFTRHCCWIILEDKVAFVMADFIHSIGDSNVDSLQKESKWDWHVFFESISGNLVGWFACIGLNTIGLIHIHESDYDICNVTWNIIGHAYLSLSVSNNALACSGSVSYVLYEIMWTHGIIIMAGDFNAPRVKCKANPYFVYSDIKYEC